MKRFYLLKTKFWLYCPNSSFVEDVFVVGGTHPVSETGKGLVVPFIESSSDYISTTLDSTFCYRYIVVVTSHTHV